MVCARATRQLLPIACAGYDLLFPATVGKYPMTSGNVAGLEESESFYIFGEGGSGMFGGSNTDHRGSMSSGKMAVDCDTVPTASMYAAVNLAGDGQRSFAVVRSPFFSVVTKPPYDEVDANYFRGGSITTARAIGQ
jgi:hypothetical protein